MFSSGPFSSMMAAEFNGIDSYIEINGRQSLDTKYSISIMFHVYPYELNTFDYLYYGTDKTGLTLSQLRGGFFQFIPKGRDFKRRVKEAVVTGGIKKHQWQHIAAVYNYVTGEALLYYDGKKKATQLLGQRLLATQGNIRIGSSFTMGGFRGRLSCLQIYNRVLNTTEIHMQMLECPLGKEFVNTCHVLKIILHKYTLKSVAYLEEVSRLKNSNSNRWQLAEYNLL